MIQVRKLRPDDIKILLNKSKELCFDKEIMYQKLDELMVVINGGQLCGLGIGIIAGTDCLLNWINIKAEYRRDLLGTALVKTILSSAEQNGALQAYIIGKCEEFAESLGFKKVDDIEEYKQTIKVYEQIYTKTPYENLYKVSLINYFKPCSHK